MVYMYSETLVVVQSLSHVPLFVDPMASTPTDSSAQGIFQARLLQSVATSFSKGATKEDLWNATQP